MKKEFNPKENNRLVTLFNHMQTAGKNRNGMKAYALAEEYDREYSKALAKFTYGIT